MQDPAYPLMPRPSVVFGKELTNCMTTSITRSTGCKGAL